MPWGIEGGRKVVELQGRLTAAELGNKAAPAVAAAAATATLSNAIVAADFKTEYLDFFVSSSIIAWASGLGSEAVSLTSKVNQTLPGYRLVAGQRDFLPIVHLELDGLARLYLSISIVFLHKVCV
jgi:hypothetical protein